MFSKEGGASSLSHSPVSPRAALAAQREILMNSEPVGVFVIGWAAVRLQTVSITLPDVTVTDVIVRGFELYMFQGDAALYPSGPGSIIHGQLYRSSKGSNLFPLIYRNGFMSRARKIMVEAAPPSTTPPATPPPGTTSVLNVAASSSSSTSLCGTGGEMQKAASVSPTTTALEGAMGQVFLAECEEGLFPTYFSVSRAYHIPDGRWASLSLFPLVNTIPISEVRHLFAYGTLRPDDQSGAHWTAKFAEGMLWEPGYVRNVDLAFLQYPVVIIPSDPNVKHTGVHGCLMWCEDPYLFREKLKEADGIEGSPHLYQRGVVMVHPTAETERDLVPAFIYYRTPKDLNDTPVLIPSGDFCKR